MKKIYFALLFISLWNSTSFSQNPTFVTSVEGIKAYTLANGMNILLIHDATQSNFIVNMVYEVGSRHEGYGESGMAHLLEHMLFKRSTKFPDIKKAIADKGADANGTTSYDRTNYYETLPAKDENLRWALEMEADRMINAAILQSDLNAEFSVVRNEFEIGENNPSKVLTERILSSAYLWHNYGKATIGSKDDIEQVPASSLKKFYKKYYQPNNATLIIGGKFDEKKALNWISTYYGKIPRSTTKIEKTYTVEPAQDGERFVELKRNGDIAKLAMLYHSPSFSSKDYAANEALISILENDPSGPLYKALVETKLSTYAHGYTRELRDPSFSFFSCDVAKDKEVEDVQKSFFEVMNSVPKMQFTEDQLSQAKLSLLHNIDYIFNNSIELALSMTEYIGAGDWRLFFLYRDKVEALKLTDIENVAKKYYLPTNRTWGRFIPQQNSERTIVEPTKDISKLVEGYKGKAVEANSSNFIVSVDNILKSTQTGTLDSGLKYALLEKPSRGNMIEGRIMLPMGDEKSLSEKANIASFTADMLSLGTTNRTKKQINDQIDLYKLNLSISADVDALHISFSVDKGNLKNALNLIQDILKNPLFDPVEFDKLILQSKNQLENSKTDPNTLAYEKLIKLSHPYPNTHPYYYQSIDEELSSLTNIKIRDIRDFYDTFYNGQNAIATFVGTTDKAIITDFLKSTFDNWKSKSAYHRISKQYFDVKAEEKTIQVNDKTNAVLLGGINLKLSRQDPDFPALLMADELLGGGTFLSSRIPNRLREAEGLSYGAGSSLQVNVLDPSSQWIIYAYYNGAVKDKLMNSLKDEIQKVISKGFTKEEFDSSLKSWLQNRQTILGTNDYLASKLCDNLYNGRTFKDFEDLENKVKALDVQKINSCISKYFDLQKFSIINAGDFVKK